MKYKIGLILTLFPFVALAQPRKIDSAAKAALNDLLSSWTLGIDSNSEVADMRIYNKFKSLFDANATIDDDLSVFYLYDARKRSGTYQIRKDAGAKSFDMYAHDAALQIKSMSIDSVKTLASNTTDRRNIAFKVKRWIRVQKTRQYVLPDDYAGEVIDGRTIEFEDRKDSLKAVAGLKEKIDKDPAAVYEFTVVNTVRIEMVYASDSARITAIRSLENDVVCTNDTDGDAVLNQEDSLQDKPGDFTSNGQPDYDLDGITDGNDHCRHTYGNAKNQGCPLSYFITKGRFEGFIGMQVNAPTIKLPELNQLGYLDRLNNDAIDVLESGKANLKRTRNILAAYGGGNLAYYFGQKKKRSGISFGFTFSRFTATYNLDHPLYYTFKSFDGTSDYRRRVRFESLKEDIQYSILNFPVLFNYRVHLDRQYKLVLNLQLGPSLMIINNASNYDAIIDFEGLYQVKDGKIVYNSYYNRKDSTNISFTKEYIHSINSSPDTLKKMFDRLQDNAGLDLAIGKRYSGSQQNIRHIAFAANLNVDLHYKVAEGLTVKFGPQFVYGSYLPGKTRFRQIDKTNEKFQSFAKSNARSTYSAYAMALGFVYNF